MLLTRLGLLAVVLVVAVESAAVFNFGTRPYDGSIHSADQDYAASDSLPKIDDTNNASTTHVQHKPELYVDTPMISCLCNMPECTTSTIGVGTCTTKLGCFVETLPTVPEDMQTEYTSTIENKTSPVNDIILGTLGCLDLLPFSTKSCTEILKAMEGDDSEFPTIRAPALAYGSSSDNSFVMAFYCCQTKECNGNYSSQGPEMMHKSAQAVLSSVMNNYATEKPAPNPLVNEYFSSTTNNLTVAAEVTATTTEHSNAAEHSTATNHSTVDNSNADQPTTDKSPIDNISAAAYFYSLLPSNRSVVGPSTIALSKPQDLVTHQLEIFKEVKESAASISPDTASKIFPGATFVIGISPNTAPEVFPADALNILVDTAPEVFPATATTVINISADTAPEVFPATATTVINISADTAPEVFPATATTVVNISADTAPEVFPATATTVVNISADTAPEVFPANVTTAVNISADTAPEVFPAAVTTVVNISANTAPEVFPATATTVVNISANTAPEVFPATAITVVNISANTAPEVFPATVTTVVNISADTAPEVFPATVTTVVNISADTAPELFPTNTAAVIINLADTAPEVFPAVAAVLNILADTAPIVFPDTTSVVNISVDPAPNIFPSDVTVIVNNSADLAPEEFPADAAAVNVSAYTAPEIFPASAPTVNISADPAPEIFPADAATVVVYVSAGIAPEEFPADIAVNISDYTAPEIFPDTVPMGQNMTYEQAIVRSSAHIRKKRNHGVIDNSPSEVSVQKQEADTQDPEATGDFDDDIAAEVAAVAATATSHPIPPTTSPMVNPSDLDLTTTTTEAPVEHLADQLVPRYFMGIATYLLMIGCLLGVLIVLAGLFIFFYRRRKAEVIGNYKPVCSNPGQPCPCTGGTIRGRARGHPLPKTLLEDLAARNCATSNGERPPLPPPPKTKKASTAPVLPPSVLNIKGGRTVNGGAAYEDSTGQTTYVRTKIPAVIQGDTPLMMNRR